ncbi:putative short-chain dehydrogenase [Mycena capillaripes]|nr:putative short-chain dehydrogenase [Mycena capillaripes]
MSQLSSNTTAEEAADAFANEIKGKNVLITGTSVGGIGFETALAIAKYANFVIITGHNADRLKIAEEAIKKQTPSANIRPLILDLSSFASVRRAAEEVNAYPEPLHVIIHNAAAAVGPFKLTADNLESQIQTNHISPFLLTKLLVPKILATRTAEYTPRVIFVSSGAHAAGAGVNFDTLGKPDPESYKRMDTYVSTKAANILSGIELSKRSKGQINAYSLHPGVIFTNGMKKEETVPEMQQMGVLDADGKPNTEKFPFKTLAQGGATTVAAAFDPALNDKPGAYLVDCVVASETVAPHSSDPASADKLWTLTEKILGETFVF